MAVNAIQTDAAVTPAPAQQDFPVPTVKLPIHVQLPSALTELLLNHSATHAPVYALHSTPELSVRRSSTNARPTRA